MNYKDLYRPTDIIKLLLSEPRKYLRKDFATFEKVKPLVNNRFKSKYAKTRWGVEEVSMPDGSVKRHIHKNKLYLWEGNPDYTGRPIKVTKGVWHE